MIQSTFSTPSELSVTALERFLAAPRLHQSDHIDVGAGLSQTWDAVRHLDFGRSPLVRALFSLRTLPGRLRRRGAAAPRLRIDDITATRDGFRILDERPGSSITVGAIGKIWQPDIEFADVAADRYKKFDDPGWVKVAWEIRCEPRGDAVTRVTVELRVTATDDASWRRFQNYFLLVGPFSHFIRHHMLALLEHELGSAKRAEQQMALPGDELLPGAVGQVTHGVTIEAPPDAIWPWLVQMGCNRAGWYSWDVLDNAGVTSAREIISQFQSVHVGDMLPATPKEDAAFEVLQVEPNRALVLGGLWDLDRGRQLPFNAGCPAHYWHVTWAFMLEPLDHSKTRLHVRGRAGIGPQGLSARARVLVMRPIHHFMETAQLRNLRDRVQKALAISGASAHDARS
jgi:hypothetical protein